MRRGQSAPDLCQRLGLAVPVVQSPMAGVSNAELAAAVSRAGALGSISVGAMAVDAADAAIGEALAATAGRLNVNVFVHPPPQRDAAREAAWLRVLEPQFREFGAAPPAALAEIYPSFNGQLPMLEVLCAHRPPVVSFHFGVPEAAAVAALHGYGACLLGTATCLAEARQLAAAGIDVIVAQGWEAGGHRGAFGAHDEALSTFTLLPRLAAALDLPVLAAGGISSGAGIAAALALGGAGAQLGTAFVECPESSADAAYRQALRDPHRRTAMTAVFSGRPARGLVNRFTRELDGLQDRVPAYPVAYDAGKRLAAAAVAAGSREFTAMWAGQGPLRDRVLPAGELVDRLDQELQAALSGAPAPGIR